MRALPVLLLAGLLLAGCLSSPSSNTTGPAGSTSSAVRVLPATLQAPVPLPELKLGSGSGEPNIAIAPDGTIYVTPIDHVYRSKDGGKTFQALGQAGCNFPFITGPCPPGQTDTIAETEGHGDGDITIDGRGCVHWLGLGTGIPYQVSCDEGATWSKAVDISSGTGSDREWIDSTLDGHLFAGWRDADGYQFNGSLDGGASWTGKVKVAEDFLGGPILHDPTNATTLYIPGVTFGGIPPSTEAVKGPGLYLFRSVDSGLNWSALRILNIPVGPADVLFTTQIFPVVAADEEGNLYLALSIKQNLVPAAAPKATSQYGIFLMTSKDHGATWTQPRIISSPLKAAVMPAIAAGAAGRIAVAWYENTLGLPNDVLPDAWNVKLYEGLGQQDGAGAGTSTVVQLNNLPNHIGSLCTNGTLCVAGGDRCLLDFFEVALTLEGQPLVTWANCSGGTGVGLAAQGTDIYFGGIREGTPLR